jgi:probable rRNA maturation factor
LEINFFSEDTNYELSNQQQYVDWIFSFVKSHNKSVGDLNYIFCSDSFILDINKEHLKHDYFTDIITFNYNEGDSISGDVFISVDTVAVNAKDYKVTFANELTRVIAHGALHLIGFNDKTEEDQNEMTRQEDICISGFN